MSIIRSRNDWSDYKRTDAAAIFHSNDACIVFDSVYAPSAHRILKLLYDLYNNLYVGHHHFIFFNLNFHSQNYPQSLHLQIVLIYPTANYLNQKHQCTNAIEANDIVQCVLDS